MYIYIYIYIYTTTWFGEMFGEHIQDYRESSILDRSKSCILGKTKEQYSIQFLENCLNCVNIHSQKENIYGILDLGVNSMFRKSSETDIFCSSVVHYYYYLFAYFALHYNILFFLD